MTMPTDAEIAALCALIYQPNSIVTGFDYFDAGMDDGVCWALKRLDGFDVIVFRGSLTLQDWLRDFRALAVPVTGIGHVHAGFCEGMAKMWAEASGKIQQPVIVTGHSLGAARADVLAAMMVAENKAPKARIVLGEPKPGLMDFAAMVGNSPGRSYRNGNGFHHDLVTDVPFSFPPEEYVHPTEVIPVCCEPTGDMFAQLGIFAWHHAPLYVKAIAMQDIGGGK